jgi:hypothetical protein
MPIPASVAELIERFARNIRFRESATRTRQPSIICWPIPGINTPDRRHGSADRPAGLHVVGLSEEEIQIVEGRGLAEWFIS